MVRYITTIRLIFEVKEFGICLSICKLGDVNEVQSLIDSGVELNHENSHPLHDSIALHLVGSTFEIV